MTSTSAVGAHGYNNEQFQSSTGSSRQQHHGHYKSKPLKQLVVTAGKSTFVGQEERAHGRYIFGRFTFGCYILDISSSDS